MNTGGLLWDVCVCIIYCILHEFDTHCFYEESLGNVI